MQPLARKVFVQKLVKKNEQQKHRVRAFGDNVNCNSGGYVYYRGRNNSNANNGLFQWNNYGASSANNNIGSRILGQKRQS